MFGVWLIIRTSIQRFESEDGATMVEYGIMLAFIAAVSVLIITTLGVHVGSLFDSVDF